MAYATAERQLLLSLKVAPGTTAAQAIEASGIRGRFPEIEEQPVVGVFGRKIALDDRLSAGDRLEIYRPLLADPKELRRRKAEQQKAEQGGRKRK